MSRLTQVKALFSSAKLLFSNHPVCIVNSILVTLSAVSEILYAEFVFKCPKDPSWYYSWVLLFSPVIILLICGMVLNTDFWLVFHGICHRKKTGHISLSVCCNTFWSVAGRALIVPSTWLFVSLLDGDYYACQYSDKPIDEKSENYLQYKADSQTFAWIFLIAAIVFGAFVACCVRCSDNKTFLEARYAGVHQLEETSLLEEKMKEVAKAEVKKHLGVLFENNIPPKATWDEATEVDYGDKDRAYYTPLYRWAITHKCKECKPGEQREQNPSQVTITVEGNQNEPSVQA